MLTQLQINRSNGAVTVNGFSVTPQTKIGDLPSFFSIGEEQQIMVLRKRTKCVFASATTNEENIDVKTSLRFEESILVSIFFELTDKNRDYKDQLDFYNSVSEREALHLNWLTQKLGADHQQLSSLAWGNLGVAQDKDGGVHIFFHNSNSSWGKSRHA